MCNIVGWAGGLADQEVILVTVASLTHKRFRQLWQMESNHRDICMGLRSLAVLCAE